MYFVDQHGYLRKRVGHDFYIFRWNNRLGDLDWLLDNTDIDKLVEYSIDELERRTYYDDRPYVTSVLEYMKNEFYKDILENV